MSLNSMSKKKLARRRFLKQSSAAAALVASPFTASQGLAESMPAGEEAQSATGNSIAGNSVSLCMRSVSLP
jgi:hypothetical protein